MNRDEQLLKHLQGAHLERIEERETDWLFQFDTKCSLAIECLWRLVCNDAIEITSEDQGQKFGHPTPLDAGLVAKERVGRDVVSRVLMNPATSDLSLEFQSGRVLQFINTSSGFESWSFFWDDTQVIGRNGDRIIIPRN